MNKNNGLHEVLMLIIIYAVGLTSTMSLALESKQSPITLLAASTMEKQLQQNQQFHNEDRTDRMQNKEEVHDDKCWAYKKQLEEIEQRLQGRDNANPTDPEMSPTETSMRTTEGKEKDDLQKEAKILRNQIHQYCDRY